MTRGYINSHARIKVNPLEPGLVCGLDMKQQIAGTVFDKSGNGLDGEIKGSMRSGSDVLGDYLAPFEFAATSIDTAISAFAGEFTVAFWVDISDITTTSWIVGAQGNNTKFGFNAGNFFVRVDPSGSGDTSVTARLGKQLLGLTRDSSDKVDLWINDETPVRLFSDVAQSSAATKYDRIMGDTGSTDSLRGKMYNAQMLNFAQEAAWFAEQYDLGKTALFQTLPVNNTGTITSGNIGDSPFRVDSGGFAVVDDTIDGESVKAIECITAGVCYVPTSLFQQSPTEAAYGGFKLSVKKADASNIVILLVQDEISDATSGSSYNIIYRSSEAITLRRDITNLISGATVAALTKVDLEVTRKSDGEFELFINGASQGTFTDTTYTESKYIVLDLDAGDIVYLEPFIKRLLP